MCYNTTVIAINYERHSIQKWSSYKFQKYLVVSGHWAKSAVDRHWWINILWCSWEYKENACREALDKWNLRFEERLIVASFRCLDLVDYWIFSNSFSGYKFCIGCRHLYKGKINFEFPRKFCFLYHIEGFYYKGLHITVTNIVLSGKNLKISSYSVATNSQSGRTGFEFIHYLYETFSFYIRIPMNKLYNVCAWQSLHIAYIWWKGPYVYTERLRMHLLYELDRDRRWW